MLAKMASNVDLISGGRLVFGLGAGWQENEHTAYGIDFSHRFLVRRAPGPRRGRGGA